MEGMINLGLIQMSCGEDARANFDKAVRYIRQAASQGANIICTQELFKSRYFCQAEDSRLFDLAEEVSEGSRAVRELSELAKDLEVVLIASLFEKRAPGLYHNATAVLDADGSYLGKHRKMHIPHDPLYYEKYFFTPGDLGYQVFKTRYADIGILICWDQWFPEAARLIALRGAQIIFYPTAIGYSPGERDPEGIMGMMPGRWYSEGTRWPMPVTLPPSTGWDLNPILPAREASNFGARASYPIPMGKC